MSLLEHLGDDFRWVLLRGKCDGGQRWLQPGIGGGSRRRRGQNFLVVFSFQFFSLLSLTGWYGRECQIRLEQGRWEQDSPGQGDPEVISSDIISR